MAHKIGKAHRQFINEKLQRAWNSRNNPLIPLPLSPQEYPDSKYIILTIVTSSYLRLALNWWQHLMRLGVSPERVLLLTNMPCTNLTGNGTEFVGALCRYHQWSELFKKRTVVLHELLREGKTVVSSDVDAVWLHSCVFDFIHSPRYMNDIAVFSAGTWPPVLARKWNTNTTACTGFVVYRPAAASLISMVLSETTIGPGWDDQLLLNRVLSILNVQWQHFDQGYKGVLSNGESVFLLNNTLVMRLCETNRLPTEACVAHCDSAPQHPMLKEKMLHSYGLWFDDEIYKIY